jgi:hypothetical protein
MSHGSDNKDVKKKKKSWSSTCFPSQHTELHVRNRSLRWKCDALAVVTDFIALSLFVATFAACTQGVVFTHHCCRLMRSRRVALFCFTFFRLFEKKKKKNRQKHVAVSSAITPVCVCMWCTGRVARNAHTRLYQTPLTTTNAHTLSRP